MKSVEIVNIESGECRIVPTNSKGEPVQGNGKPYDQNEWIVIEEINWLEIVSLLLLALSGIAVFYTFF